MIGAFRRRIAGLRCPRCGSQDVQVRITLASFPGIFFVGWPFAQAASGRAVEFGACEAWLASSVKARVWIVLVATSLAVMALYAVYPLFEFQPFFSLAGLALGYLFFDPLAARFGLTLEAQ
jgi:hypothetical protein